MTNHTLKWPIPWLALFGGVFGAHRFYLFGLRDLFAWAHIPFALAGIAGVVRMRNLGQDDVLSWYLAPILGFTIAIATLGGIIYTLMNDDRFNARFNGGEQLAKMSWAAVLGVVACLVICGTATMASFAFSFQKYFESQVKTALVSQVIC